MLLVMLLDVSIISRKIHHLRYLMLLISYALLAGLQESAGMFICLSVDFQDYCHYEVILQWILHVFKDSKYYI